MRDKPQDSEACGFCFAPGGDIISVYGKSEFKNLHSQPDKHPDKDGAGE